MTKGNELGIYKDLALYPMLTLVFGIIALVLCILRKKILYLVGGIMGILAFIFPIVYMMRLNDITAPLNVIGMGVYLSMVGGILALVGGILGFVKYPKA